VKRLAGRRKAIPLTRVDAFGFPQHDDPVILGDQPQDRHLSFRRECLPAFDGGAILRTRVVLIARVTDVIG